MGKIGRMLVWLSRIGHCRGFGVQSPWAYSMVRYVINEHYPYYAYAPLRQQFGSLDTVERKRCELCLRLANRVQPTSIATFGGDDETWSTYFRAGCKAAHYYNIDLPTAQSMPESVDLMRIAPAEGFRTIFSMAAERAHDGTALMLDDIRRNPEARRLWYEIAENMEGVVTFDLYYCGLVFFESKRYKQNYIINF